MAVWNYQPQQVFSDTNTAPARSNNVTLAQGVVGLDSQDTIRTFRLQYGVVTPQEALGMRAFFQARSGGFESFDWVHPTDNRIYKVRFSSTMRLELFTPIFFQNQLLEFEVVL